MMIVPLIALFLYATYCTIYVVRHDVRARRAKRDEDSFSSGDSVETDCRACGQFNRVPFERLRDRPKCGRCKNRLMPGHRLILVRVKVMDAEIRRDLDTYRRDEDKLWSALADTSCFDGTRMSRSAS